MVDRRSQVRVSYSDAPRNYTPRAVIAMTWAELRVRWGTPRFWRINEFASEEAAREFARAVGRTHEAEAELTIVVERRRGTRWSLIEW